MSEILSSPHSSPPGSDTALALRDSFDAFLPPFERKEIHDRLARDVYKLQSDDGGTFDISRANLEDLLQIWAVFRGRLSPLFLINQNKEPLSLETFREDAVVVVNLPSHFSSKGEYQGVSVFSPADVLPGWIAYVESGGILYERKKSPTPPSGEDVAKAFLAGKISAQELLLKKRQESDVFVPVWGAGTPLSLVSGQQIRLIGNTTLEEAKRSGRPLHEAIRGLLRQKQAEAFKDQYRHTMISLQAQFPGITPAHSEAILAIIGRFNPDFNVRAPWGISKLSPEKIAGVEAQLGRAFNPLSVEDHLFAMYSVFHAEVVKNNAIRSFADQVKQLHSSNPLSDKTIDIEAQVYALYYVFISHTEPVTEIDEKDFEEFSELLLKRLWRIPTQSEIIDTYRNYRLLESLKAKGILPVNEIISKDALVTTQDFLSYFYDLVDEIGIPKIRLAVPLAVTGPSPFSKTLKYMGNLFRKRESVRELANGTRLVTTWCMQTVRYGFSRIYGFTLGGYGDMVDIYKEGVDVYAEKVKQAFTAAGKGSAFLGYDPDFSKTHMNAPADANIAMVFPDTTRRQWGRMVGGHVAFAYKNAQGSWLVYDEYYQGWLGPLKKIEEYYSEKNGGLWHSHNLKDTERIKGAIFFKWPLPDFIQQAK